jgi:hypothetical protein
VLIGMIVHHHNFTTFTTSSFLFVNQLSSTKCLKLKLYMDLIGGRGGLNCHYDLHGGREGQCVGKHFIITSYGNISDTRCTLCDVNFKRLEHEILKVLTQCFSYDMF